MIYVNSINSEKFNLYTLFLKHLLDGNDKYKFIVDDVLNETRLLSSGKKDLFEIDRENYHIIVYLKNMDSAYYKSIADKPLDISAYTKTLSLLSEECSFELA